MVTPQGNLAAIAAEKFALAVLAVMSYLEWESLRTPEERERREISPFCRFSGIKKGIGIGKWGSGTFIFDVEGSTVYKVQREARGTVVYRIPFIGQPGQFPSGEGSIEEVLFGSSGFSRVAFGGPHEMDKSDKTETLLARLRAQEIEPFDYEM